MTGLSSSPSGWPTIAESHELLSKATNFLDGSLVQPRNNDSVNISKKDSTDDWEMLSQHCSGGMPSTTVPPRTQNKHQLPQSEQQPLPHAMSTPDFGQFECCSSESSGTSSSRSSFVLDDDDDLDDDFVALPAAAEEESSMVMISSNIISPATSGTGEKGIKVRRVPSFKDALLLNAEEMADNEKREAAQKAAGEKEAAARLAHRARKVRPRIVVRTFDRRAQSTGDLRLLTAINDCDGVVGGSNNNVSDDDMVLGNRRNSSVVIADVWDNDEENCKGACDAEEYYARKHHGHLSRKNGLKVRPDEAKRKAIIMHKKDSQRQQQQKHKE